LQPPLISVARLNKQKQDREGKKMKDDKIEQKQKAPFEEPLTQIIQYLRKDRILLFALGFAIVLLPAILAGKFDFVVAISLLSWGVIALVVSLFRKPPSPDKRGETVDVGDYIKLHLHERVRVRLRSNEDIEGEIVDLVPSTVKIKSSKGDREVQPTAITNIWPL
jgi:hypothetical protein